MRKLRTHELGRIGFDQYVQTEKIPVVVVMDQVRSGNNVGSVFRTADALLVRSLFLCGITAVPPVRDIRKTALGAEKIVNWRYFSCTEDAVKLLKEEGYLVYAVEQAEGSIPLPVFFPDHSAGLALVFGNEVKGVQQKVIDLCDGVVEVPQFGTKHSLNVAVCAGIVLWDIFYKIKK